MAILTKNTGSATDFQACPQGDFQAVVCDVADLGWIEKKFEGVSQGMKPHVQVVYQVVGTDENDEPVLREDGTPFLVFGRRCVLSMHERSSLYKEICGIIGKSAVDAALENGTLDTEELVGKNVQLVVVHNIGNDGKTYANIENCKPWNKKYGALQGSRDYTRRSDREDWAEKQPAVSAFVDPAEGQRLMAEAAGQQRLPDAPQSTPRAVPKPQAVAPGADPRSVNQLDTRKATAKALAKGYDKAADEEIDDTTIFDDDISDEKRDEMLAAAHVAQPALIGAGTGAQAAYPAN